MRYPGLSPAQRHGRGMSRDGAGESNHSSPAKGHSVLRPDTTVRGSRGTAELCLHRAASLQSFVSASVGGLNPGSRLLQSRRFSSHLISMRFADSSVSEIHVRASIASPGVNQTLSQRPQRVQVTPNHALQRTAPRVTARAFCERSAIYIWASVFRPTVGHAPRHAPPSLSLGSLGRFARFLP